MKKRILSAVFALVTGLVVAGCASNGSATGPATVANDQFSKTLEIRGPSEYENPLVGISKMWFLRSAVDKTNGYSTTQLYVYISYLGGSWNFFGRAADIETTPLPVVKLGSNVDSCRTLCSYSETIGIDVDPSVLARFMERGYPVKVYGKSGESFVVTVTPGQIASQLDALKQAKATSASNARKPLGVRFSDATASLYAAFGKPNQNGVFIMEVTPNSVADKAGIMVGDIVYKFDGKPIGNSGDLKTMVAEVKAGKKVPLEGYRAGKKIVFTASF